MTVEEIKKHLKDKIDLSLDHGKMMGLAMKLFKDSNLNAQGADVKQAIKEMSNE